MLKNKLILFAILLFVAIQISVSQNNTNSPYTRFGFGDISDNNSGEQRGMGGVGIGLRNKTGINTINPASYSCVDSMTFMFDIGVSALYSRFTETAGSTNKLNANLEYITMQFPLSKNFGFSAGLLPYSFSGYNFSENANLTTSPDTVVTTKSYFGNGGISQVYGGISYKFLDHISLGVNAYYMFGSSVNSRLLSFTNLDNTYNSYQSDSIAVSNLRFRYGLQFFNTFNKKHEVNLGLIYEFKNKLNARFSEFTQDVGTDLTAYKEVYSKFETPAIYGVGLNYTYNNKISVALDYSLQKWSDVQYFGVVDSLNDRSKIALGVEFLPNPRGRKFTDKLLYRAGLNISEPYYKFEGSSQPKNFGISFGIGMPLKSSKTVVNTSFEYGKIGTSGLLREDYFKFTLNATFNENWFFKRKL